VKAYTHRWLVQRAPPSNISFNPDAVVAAFSSKP
jgi:hypothetical protein